MNKSAKCPKTRHYRAFWEEKNLWLECFLSATADSRIFWEKNLEMPENRGFAPYIIFRLKILLHHLQHEFYENWITKNIVRKISPTISLLMLMHNCIGIFYCLKGGLWQVKTAIGHWDNAHKFPGKETRMLKIRIQGTKNDVKSFIKWFRRATSAFPKYEINSSSELLKNKDTDVFVRWYANVYTKDNK